MSKDCHSSALANKHTILEMLASTETLLNEEVGGKHCTVLSPENFKAMPLGITDLKNRLLPTIVRTTQIARGEHCGLLEVIATDCSR